MTPLELWQHYIGDAEDALRVALEVKEAYEELSN